jgi:hypothetical protein
MAKTMLDLINLALVRVGNAPLASLSGSGRAENIAQRLFPEARDEVLRLTHWTCAIARSHLDQVISGDMDEYGYAYALPTDCVMVIATIPAGPYLIEGTTLYSDYSDTVAPLGLRYIKRIENPTLMDDLLYKSIGLRLAGMLAVHLVNKPDLQAIINQELAAVLPMAMNQSGIESTGQPQATQYWDEM